MNKHRYSLVLSLIAAMTLLGSAELKALGASAPVREHAAGLPRIVVSILVDQLRSDYLEAFAPLYGDGGFRLLLDSGRIYTNAYCPYAHPDLASVAATIASGSSPSQHGIVARQWLNRETLRPVFCLQDDAVRGVYTSNRYSPQWLRVSTVGDELKLRSGGRSEVVSIAADAEAAVLMGGHAANHALWIDESTGLWASSSYYGDFPSWGETRNRYAPIHRRVESEPWTPLSQSVADFAYFPQTAQQRTFSHRFKGEHRFESYKTSALVNEEIAATVVQALQDGTLGSDATTDYLAVSLYAGTHENRSLRERGAELQDTYARLDHALAYILSAVEQKVGRGNALFALTASGKDDDDDDDLVRYRIPTGVFDMRRATSLLGIYLVNLYGQGAYIEATDGTQLYFNRRLLEERHISLSEIQRQAQNFLLQLDGVERVLAAQDLRLGQGGAEDERQRAAYCPERSGDVIVQVCVGWKVRNAEGHQQAAMRASYIHYPLMLYGSGIERSLVTTPVGIDYIAPTLSKAMRIRAPNSCIRQPLL